MTEKNFGYNWARSAPLISENKNLGKTGIKLLKRLFDAFGFNLNDDELKVTGITSRTVAPDRNKKAND
ncbi:MAG: hypothetical protein QNL62_17385 [Gammaproteobacteria bacterium]|nr:hypothetical protein [Gammaproteobacteria bacterium]